MDTRPELARLSESEKDALIAALWAEVQRLQARLAALEAKPPEPRKDAHHSRVPPSHSPKANRPTGPRRERGAKPVWAALVGAGGCTQTRTKSSWPRPRPARMVGAWCRCRHNISMPVYDKIELPPVTPIVTRVEQYRALT